MTTAGTPEQTARATEASLKMKEFDLAELRQVYEDAGNYSAAPCRSSPGRLAVGSARPATFADQDVLFVS
jgi:hypothetical protein